MINLSLFAAECASKGFLGLKPWYAYINDSDHFNGCDVKTFTVFPGNGQASDVPLVLLAIVDDLLRLAGIIAVGFVLVGAIRFITSQGNPEDATSARNTVINALAGLVVSIIAIAFVSFLGSRLGK